MSTYIAFLRGMNLGKRRIKNPELVACFEDMGFAGAVAVQASGNVIFDGGGRTEAELKSRIESGLQTRLDYAVPTRLRSGAEVRAIAEAHPFDAATLAGTEGRVQVILIDGGADITLDADVQAAIRAEQPADDRLIFEGRQIFWLPKAGLSTSAFDQKALDRRLGITTVRTWRTFGRLAKKLP